MKLINFLDSFKKQTILVIGDTMVDKFIWGKVSRISPEAPVPVVEITKETETLGAAGNVANNITALGAKAVIISAIGEDNTGKSMFEMLEEKGIDASRLVYELRDRKSVV